MASAQQSTVLLGCTRLRCFQQGSLLYLQSVPSLVDGPWGTTILCRASCLPAGSLGLAHSRMFTRFPRTEKEQTSKHGAVQISAYIIFFNVPLPQTHVKAKSRKWEDRSTPWWEVQLLNGENAGKRDFVLIFTSYCKYTNSVTYMYIYLFKYITESLSSNLNPVIWINQSL